MKILLIQDYLRSGGTERQSLLLAHGFAAAGHPTTLLTFRPGGRLSPKPSAAGTASPGISVSIRSLQSFDTKLDWFAPGLLATVRQTAPDLILCMGRMANCYAGKLQGNLPTMPVISTMRTGKSLPWLFRRSLRKTRHIVANSRDAKVNLITQHGIPGEKISVIYNSLVFSADPSIAFTPNSQADGIAGAKALAKAIRDSFRATRGVDFTTTILLSVAMFRPEKNQRELVEIVSLLPADLNWQFWLAGDGPDRRACERLVADKKLGARIKFLGWQADPAPLYRAADIAIHASRSESLSNFLIEAQAAGLPAVAYGAQGIGECFIPDQTGFVITGGNRLAFCAAITALARATPAVREARTDQSRAFALTTFDPERQVAAYLALFETLLPANSHSS
jgi:glycosyltransferase involved in cell wall biosynthesis